MDVKSYNSSISYKQYKQVYQPSFRAYVRIVNDSSGQLKYRTNTWFFRNDLDWDAFVKFIDKRFASSKQVPIVNLACSDGEESYTLAYKLLELLKTKAKKFFPIQASDIDAMNIKIAKNNSSYSTDIYEAEHINRSDNNIHKYFSVEYDDDGYPSNISPLNSLKNQIQFCQKDAMFVVQDLPKGNQVVLLRNCLPYLSSEKRENILALLSKKLTHKSILVLGDFDAEIPMLKSMLLRFGFRETPINNVYKKTPRNFFKKISLYFKQEKQKTNTL